MVAMDHGVTMDGPPPPFSQYSHDPDTPPSTFTQTSQQWTAHGGNIVINISQPGADAATGRGIVIGMLSALGSAIFIVLVFCLIYCLRFTTGGRILLDRVTRPGAFDDEQARLREEAEALETMGDLDRAEYLRAKAFIEANPPETIPTDISLSQFLAIQEKGVSAWEFEPELEIANCFVEGRTEIEFFDSECTVQTNLPMPKQNEVYYWEAKIYEKPETTTINLGVTTKPYPLFRLPGLHRTSIAYTSSGQRRHNQPFTGTNYGPEFVHGDVVGCGYRPRTGTIFFTRNGRRLEDVAHGLKTQNFFPSVGANGPCHVHVNFGQSGFVFIEANVKKWGLAPMTGSLAPPPPYGSEQGSILLETGGQESAPSPSPQRYRGGPGHGRQNSRFRPVLGGPTSPGPVRSPTDISLAQLVHVPSEEDIGEGSSGANAGLSGDSGLDNAHGLGVQYFSDRHSSLSPHPPAPLPGIGPHQGTAMAASPNNGGTEAPPHTQGPPPDYESPATSPTDSQELPTLPQQRQEEHASRQYRQHRAPHTGRESPQVPSYESAMAETRERISEAVSEGGGDDEAAASDDSDLDESQIEREVQSESADEDENDDENHRIGQGAGQQRAADRAPLLPRYRDEHHARP